ncbi:hypothetical protein A2U01_0076446, partial [Trifolium medium]|nr:hypothetical protein [Trifolium medium]
MMNSHFVQSYLRVGAYTQIHDGENNVGDNRAMMGYVFLGVYLVDAHFEILTEDSFIVHEYLLDRVSDNDPQLIE